MLNERYGDFEPVLRHTSTCRSYYTQNLWNGRAVSGVQSPTEHEKERVGGCLLSLLGDLNPGFDRRADCTPPLVSKRSKPIVCAKAQTKGGKPIPPEPRKKGHPIGWPFLRGKVEWNGCFTNIGLNLRKKWYRVLELQRCFCFQNPRNEYHFTFSSYVAVDERNHNKSLDKRYLRQRQPLSYFIIFWS